MQLKPKSIFITEWVFYSIYYFVEPIFKTIVREFDFHFVLCTSEPAPDSNQLSKWRFK